MYAYLKRRKSYVFLKQTEIVLVLKRYGNRTRTKNVRKSYAFEKLTDIVGVLKTSEILRVLKTYGNHSCT